MYTPPNVIDQGKLGLMVGAKVLDTYEEYFDVPYPLKKQGYIIYVFYNYYYYFVLGIIGDNYTNYIIYTWFYYKI